MTPAQRASLQNGIWLCSECADRVDKPENEVQFPVELLRHWKRFGESTTGTDHASKAARAACPLRNLVLSDFAGVRGTVSIPLGALNIFLGSSKLSYSVCKLLSLLGDRDAFESVRQPRSGISSWTHFTLPIDESVQLVATVTTDTPRIFTQRGRLTAELSDGRSASLVIEQSGAKLYVDDVYLPAFSPVLHVVSTNDRTSVSSIRSALEQSRDPLLGLSSCFQISVKELEACFGGAPMDESLFGYSYEVSPEHGLCACSIHGSPTTSRPVGSLSSGELERVVLDLLARLATYAATLRPTVLAVDQARIPALDHRGWAMFLQWVDRKLRPFQVVVDRAYAPSEGQLSHAMCYVVGGTDMNVSTIKQVTWAEFKSRT